MRRRTATALVATALVLAAGGCGTDPAETVIGPEVEPTTEAPAETTAPPTTSPVTVPPNGETFTVQAVDNSFVPEESTVAAGTLVVFSNRGRNDHNVIPEDPDAPWRIDADAFTPGAASEGYVFNRPGTYRYYCSIHGTIDAGMPGVLIVE